MPPFRHATPFRAGFGQADIGSPTRTCATQCRQSRAGRAPTGEPMSRKRRSYESGHKPKFMVVVDETPECDRALYFASRRAARVGVAVLMRAEAHEEANAMLARASSRANGIAGITPEQVIREGEPVEEILKLIEEDEDIAVLVLAAGVDQEGPGPLVTNFAKAPGTFPIPVAIVPGHLSDEEIDAMT